MDECDTDNGGCNQTCTNTQGSFECSCGVGYVLADDDLNCDGKFHSHKRVSNLAEYSSMPWVYCNVNIL